METTLKSQTVEVSGLNLHYLSAGKGEPVLLLHGWPTSSFLWRRVIPAIAEKNHVIALDLPGFGRSDKPLDATYSFRFFDGVLDGFLAALDIETISLAVHDLGGPIGLYWACRNPSRIRRLALLNTLVYPEVSWAVKLFVIGVRTPFLRDLVTSSWGLKKALEIGVTDKKRLSDDAVAGIRAPFTSREDRRALAKAGCRLSPKGFALIARRLPELTCPVRIVYGEGDRILPEVAQTMARVKKDLPQAEVTALPDCGHFLQEERGEEIGRLLAPFFAP